MCGIIGAVSSRGDVAPDIYIGLWTLQHRGQESAGIVVRGADGYHAKKGMGTVDTVFFGDRALSGLKGGSGIGHTRYSTTGGSTGENVQPVEGCFRGVPFWLSHNGNLVRYGALKTELERGGYRFKTTTDTEVIAALVGRSSAHRFEDALSEALAAVEGTYALVALYDERVVGVRDPAGNRPLVIGAGEGLTVLASESATCDVLDILTLRDVAPGEMVVIDSAAGNWYRYRTVPAAEKFCIFEFVYFLRPDSRFLGRGAQAVRERMGRFLWREAPVDADIVISVPDSGNCAAEGVAMESGLPLKMLGIFRSHYVGRTFIEPIGPKRARELNIKFNPIADIVRGKRLVVVDDSIVRANVAKKVVGLLREKGAKEIHMRISSPPYCHPCHYGIDTYRVEDELAGRRHRGDVELIRQEIGADTLHYLSLEKLKEAVSGGGAGDCEVGFCDACFTGDYPIPVK